jgi:hypothetical protein
LAGQPPSSPPESPGMFGRFPIRGRKALIAIAVFVAAVGIAIAVVYTQQGQRAAINESAPAVRFVEFEADRDEIRVGESATYAFNVENFEGRVIDSARVVTTVEPQVGKTYLSISNSTVDLPALPEGARTGSMEVSVVATGAPAIEATYNVKVVLSVQGTVTDARDLQLTILNR